MRILLSFCLALLLVPTWGRAAEMPQVAGGSGPVEITAEQSMEWRQAERMYMARGKAKATRGELSIEADEMAAYERPSADGQAQNADGKRMGNIARLTAKGNVRILSPKQQVYGDEAVYDLDRHVATLTGQNLRFVSDNAVVTARDSLEYWDELNQAFARGHAVAVRDDRRVESDLMTASFERQPNGEMILKRLTAEGNVTVITGRDVARGDKAVYDMVRNVATLSGRVRVTHGDNQLEGTMAEVDFATGRSRMLSGQAKAGEGKRVRALFVPDAKAGKDAVSKDKP